MHVFMSYGCEKYSADESTTSLDILASNDGYSISDEKNYISYCGCSCGSCSIKDFIEGKIMNCPMSSARNGVCLVLTTRSNSNSAAQIKYSEYKLSIQRQSQLMQSDFTRLMTKTIRDFTKEVQLNLIVAKIQNQITPHDTRNPLYERIYRTNCKRLKKLSEVSTYGQLQEFLILNYCAWFNVDLIADLRRVLLDYSESDHVISEYEGKVINYLRKCCFTGKTYTSCSEIVCEAPTDFRTVKNNQTERFKRKLQQIFHIPECESVVDEESGKLILFVEKIQDMLTPLDKMVRITFICYIL